MNGKYALFLYEMHEASGGFDDLKFVGSLEACVERAGRSDHMEAAQIVDLEALRVVKRGEWTYSEHPLVGHPIIWRYELTDTPEQQATHSVDDELRKKFGSIYLTNNVTGRPVHIDRPEQEAKQGGEPCPKCSDGVAEWTMAADDFARWACLSCGSRGHIRQGSQPQSEAIPSRASMRTVAPPPSLGLLCVGLPQ